MKGIYEVNLHFEWQNFKEPFSMKLEESFKFIC